MSPERIIHYLTALKSLLRRIKKVVRNYSAGGAGKLFSVCMVDFDIAVIRFYTKLYQGGKGPWYCRAKVLSG